MHASDALHQAPSPMKFARSAFERKYAERMVESLKGALTPNKLGTALRVQN